MRRLFVALGLAICSCQSPEARSIPRVEVGVFFGGQIQRLKRVEIPPVRAPKVGFRVELPQDSNESVLEPIVYEIVRPGPAGRRVTEKGTLSVPRGEGRIDHVIHLDAESKLGLWNVRVVQGSALLADRALYLVESRASPL